MKRAIVLGSALVTFIVFQAYSQCQKTHYFCTAKLSKEEQAEYWNLNNQSQSAVFAKGEVYEMSFIAYKGYDYRLTVCTDIAEGGDAVMFELLQDEVVRVKDDYGNTNIKKTKESIYKNADDGSKPSISFTTDKTKKIYVKVNVPSTGTSKDKTLGKTENVCVGVLIEHKEAADLGF
ncbi:MAG: hypothetical protein IPM74_05235 [Crocinitomicaceae bacterium]|nr:hypothetical protein [Crocinitomicaceae bacterium]MBK8925307.1 hypothetical protein [Crocinitomicaceae bacterium]